MPTARPRDPQPGRRVGERLADRVAARGQCRLGGDGVVEEAPGGIDPPVRQQLDPVPHIDWQHVAPPRWRSPPSVHRTPSVNHPCRRATASSPPDPGIGERPPDQGDAPDRRRRSGRRHEHAVLRDGQRRHPGLPPNWRPFEPPQAPDGTPSVVYIVLDDVGYSAMSCYGGPIRTAVWHGEDKVGEGRIKTQPGTFMIAGKGLCIGRDSGAGVSTDYPGEMPWRFTGRAIRRVAVDVSGGAVRGPRNARRRPCSAREEQGRRTVGPPGPTTRRPRSRH